MYCLNSDKATIHYQFPGRPQDRYIYNDPPIDVEIEEGEAANIRRESYERTFDGESLTSYSFRFTAPAGVPYRAEIYLINGTWDDNGSIGTYTSDRPANQVATYGGAPIRVGKGLAISGLVNNTIRPNCSVSLTLEWRWGQEKYSLKVLKDGQEVFRDTGSQRPRFSVSCSEKCPPNTYCECECGDYLCCYDRSGNPIARIFQR